MPLVVRLSRGKSGTCGLFRVMYSHLNSDPLIQYLEEER